MNVITYFEGRTELRSSYRNQQLLAIRELGGDTVCAHGGSLGDGCRICRVSACVLLPEGKVER